MIPAVRAGTLWPVYALALAHFTVATVFEPARSALVPRLVSGAELVAATTLTSVTWSVMTALGGMLGGTVLALVGAAAAFAVDALSFAGSAALIATIPAAAPASDRPAGERAGPGFADGLRYIAASPATAAVLVVKSIAGIGLVDTFLVIYATRIFPVGDGGALSLGLLWACFGLGAVLGPALLNLVNDGTVRRMRRLILVGSGLVVAGLTALAHAPSLAVAGLAIVLRGMGGSTNWTYSTVILQKIVPDGLRGRMFAMDLALLTLTAAVGSIVWGVAIDRYGLRPVVQAVSGSCALAALAWTIALRRTERSEAASTVRSPAAPRAS
jgi:predicted MFS family arabinose efflux permease